MIRQLENVFVLDTKNTTYAFRVLETGQLEHLYYGKRIRIDSASDANLLFEQHEFAPGNTNVYDAEHAQFSLEDMRLEMSAYGKGDIRDPFIELTYANGDMSSDFIFDNAAISDQRTYHSELPHAYVEDGVEEELCIVLKERYQDLYLHMYYVVYPECDAIAKSARLLNKGMEQITINRLMSNQIDFNPDEYIFHTFTGAWAREMHKNDLPITAGRYVNESYTGTSSNRANPFVMLSKKGTTEDVGCCYGFHLIYSGNHYEAVSKSSYGKVRVLTGINPQSFSYCLRAGECFDTPEAVLSYSDHGFNGLSGNLHEFVREHIIRGQWKKKNRPILLNSWEANYFDINESKLLKLAKAGKDVGIELFVMDDGWFGERNDDTTSLGDWDVNKKKLPSGLKGLCDKITDMGLMFGIWVEPEMVNVNSKLYKEHPDWVMEIPGKLHSEGRNQRMLDLGRKEVQDFIIEKMTEVFSQANITYVKWDMNRIVSDYYSQGLPASAQGEVMHRYVLGLYRCMDALTKAFPHILFEGCASGGNRFDLGILSYFPQIWGSDNTDALCRVEIQNGYSYGYPLSCVAAHVSSCPNHQTLRVTPIESRFDVAAFGICGYECNLCDMKAEDLAAVKEQIALYKEWRNVLQFGRFYRGAMFGTSRESVLENTNSNQMEWTCVSKDQTKAVGFIMQKLVVPNTQFSCYNAKGLNENFKYHFYNRSLKHNVKNFGDLVNTVSPVHIKQDSMAHNLIAKLVKMDGEKEDIVAYGDALMHAGVNLKQAFAGTGYNDNVRYYQDFATRLYFMDKIEDEIN